MANYGETGELFEVDLRWTGDNPKPWVLALRDGANVRRQGKTVRFVNAHEAVIWAEVQGWKIRRLDNAAAD